MPTLDRRAIRPPIQGSLSAGRSQPRQPAGAQPRV